MKEPLCPTPDVSALPPHPFLFALMFALSSPLPPLQVNILLPHLSTLRTVCERLKTISSTITISANRRGEFRCGSLPPRASAAGLTRALAAAQTEGRKR